jgi:hypothetical protein
MYLGKEGNTRRLEATKLVELPCESHVTKHTCANQVFGMVWYSMFLVFRPLEVQVFLQLLELKLSSNLYSDKQQ